MQTGRPARVQTGCPAGVQTGCPADVQTGRPAVVQTALAGFMFLPLLTNFSKGQINKSDKQK